MPEQNSEKSAQQRSESLKNSLSSELQSISTRYNTYMNQYLANIENEYDRYRITDKGSQALFKEITKAQAFIVTYSEPKAVLATFLNADDKLRLLTSVAFYRENIDKLLQNHIEDLQQQQQQKQQSSFHKVLAFFVPFYARQIEAVIHNQIKEFSNARSSTVMGLQNFENAITAMLSYSQPGRGNPVYSEIKTNGSIVQSEIKINKFEGLLPQHKEELTQKFYKEGGVQQQLMSNIKDLNKSLIALEPLEARLIRSQEAVEIIDNPIKATIRSQHAPRSLEQQALSSYKQPVILQKNNNRLE